MKTIKNILVATDFSPDSRSALDEAATLAEKLGAEVRLLHVVTPIADCVADYCIEGEDLEGAKNNVLRDARRNMEKEIERFSDRKGVKIIADVKYGRTYEEILKAESDMDIDLLVIGPHDRKSLWQRMFTHLSDKLEKNLRVDTLAVRHTA